MNTGCDGQQQDTDTEVSGIGEMVKKKKRVNRKNL